MKITVKCHKSKKKSIYSEKLRYWKSLTISESERKL